MTREEYTNLIVSSRATKKVVLAGAGTGKTHTFKEVLSRCEAKGLALSFISNLVRDLQKDLNEYADVFTFHGFCKYIAHRIELCGLPNTFNYYPLFLEIVAEDFGILGLQHIDVERLTNHFNHNVNANSVLDKTLELGNYYKTVSHSDLVYRALKHFSSNQLDIPEYPLIVVDEYQDFNRLEIEFINILSLKSSVLIAGDDDQALYDFKEASPHFIRQLHADPAFEKFELPYCSRCTEVIVDAYNEIIQAAQQRGLLRERIGKNYICHIDSKRADSEKYPLIEHVNCSVQRKNAPYMARYILSKIAEIPVEETRESNEKGFPTVMIIGPSQFVRQIYDKVKIQYPEAVLKKSDQPEMNIFHAYKFISENPESNLGWRIFLNFYNVENYKRLIKRALDENLKIVDLLPPILVVQHKAIAALVGKLITERALSTGEEFQLEAAVQMDAARILQLLEIETEEPQEAVPERADEIPNILCTTLLGSKGLSAQHVFIVGMNNGHFPRDAASISDKEVCSFLVGISRARKKCSLLSCSRFGNEPLRPSEFLSWITPYINSERVDKSYFVA